MNINSLLLYCAFSHLLCYCICHSFPSKQRLLELITEAKVGVNIKHIIPIEVGVPPQTLNVKLSTAICGIWLYDKDIFSSGFDSHKSSTFSSTSTWYSIDKVIGYMSYDKIKIGNTIEEIPFLLATKRNDNLTRFNYDGLIGLGYKCNGEHTMNVDLIEKYTEKDVNKQKIFYYDINLQKRTGFFAIGFMSNSIDTSSRLYRQMRINKENQNGHWEVQLHSFFFDSNMIYTDSPLSIGIGGNIMSVPSKVFTILIKNIFQKFIDKNICELYIGEVREIYCNEDFDTHIVDYLGFIVGKWHFKIYPEYMFSEVEKNEKKMKWFKVVHHPLYNQWYISQNLFGNSILLFDKEKAIIGCYQRENNHK